MPKTKKVKNHKEAVRHSTSRYFLPNRKIVFGRFVFCLIFGSVKIPLAFFSFLSRTGIRMRVKCGTAGGP